MTNDQPTEPQPEIPPTNETPTVAQFLNAAAAEYVLGGVPGGLVPFTVDGFQMTSTNLFSGMSAKVWVTPQRQIIIAYQGTTGGTNLLFNPLIAISQLLADMQVIFTNTTPWAFYDALDFARVALTANSLPGHRLIEVQQRTRCIQRIEFLQHGEFIRLRGTSSAAFEGGFEAVFGDDLELVCGRPFVDHLSGGHRSCGLKKFGCHHARDVNIHRLLAGVAGDHLAGPI